MSTEKVLVSDITEYNWMLGNRCNLLTEANLHPYTDTEEEIVDFLEKSAKDPKSMEICLNSSRCSAFYKSFCAGETPYIDKDPIKLLEYGGKYWSYEGKHRVCMAIRAGIEYIDAQVIHLEEDTETLLEPYGRPGAYTFTSFFGKKKSSGEIAILWVNPPRSLDYSEFSIGPRILNNYYSKACGKTEIIPGVYVEVKKKRLNRLFCTKCVETTVTIMPNHYNTGIWLYTLPVNNTKAEKPKTVFRYGRWRKKHMPYMVPTI